MQKLHKTLFQLGGRSLQ